MFIFEVQFDSLNLLCNGILVERSKKRKVEGYWKNVRIVCLFPVFDGCQFTFI